MCGRYALNLNPAQVRAYLRDASLPIEEEATPEPGPDADAEGLENDGEGDGSSQAPHAGDPRQSYNFAPGYRGIVYRAVVPDRGNGPDASFAARGKGKGVKEGQHDGVDGQESEERADAPCDDHDDDAAAVTTRYELKTMQWGLLPSWTKRLPDYGSMLKTINCRDDSLAQNTGLWNSIKGRKRCVIIAQGFYEWLKTGAGKVPHFVRHIGERTVGEEVESGGNQDSDASTTSSNASHLMLFAGLWDVATFANKDGVTEKRYTYTIITTDSNAQLRFLHDRMPVILERAADVATWLDPRRWRWEKDLQSLCRPYAGELCVYPVSRDVGKVGNNRSDFVVPVGSAQIKGSIENFFGKGKMAGAEKKGSKDAQGAKQKMESTIETQHAAKKGSQDEQDVKKEDPEAAVKQEVTTSSYGEPVGTKTDEGADLKQEGIEDRKTLMDHEGSEDNAPLPVPKSHPRGDSPPRHAGIKREHDNDDDSAEVSIKDDPDASPARKVSRTGDAETQITPHRVTASTTTTTTRKTRSATSNAHGSSTVHGKASASPAKGKANQKITNFFGK